MSLGNSIREYRLKKNYSVKNVAAGTGLSMSLISQVERDLASPSVASIKKIANYLEVPVAAFFNENEQHSSPVVKRNNRKKLVPPGQGIVYELLSPNLNCAIEMIYNIFDEGASTGPELYVHKGEEVGIVLQGKMEVTIGQQVYLLEEGDSIYFDSSNPHSHKNAGLGKLIAIWAITPPSF